MKATTVKFCFKKKVFDTWNYTKTKEHLFTYCSLVYNVCNHVHGSVKVSMNILSPSSDRFCAKERRSCQDVFHVNA